MKKATGLNNHKTLVMAMSILLAVVLQVITNVWLLGWFRFNGVFNTIPGLARSFPAVWEENWEAKTCCLTLSNSTSSTPFPSIPQAAWHGKHHGE